MLILFLSCLLWSSWRRRCLLGTLCRDWLFRHRSSAGRFQLRSGSVSCRVLLGDEFFEYSRHLYSKIWTGLRVFVEFVGWVCSILSHYLFVQLWWNNDGRFPRCLASSSWSLRQRRNGRLNTTFMPCSMSACNSQTPELPARCDT